MPTIIPSIPEQAVAWALFCVLGLAACAPAPPNTSPGHLAPVPGQTPEEKADIPRAVEHVPYLPPPSPAPRTEVYTVVVDQVPVRELLFALARDANLNVDIHPEIDGMVTLNALDQTLAQILERIANQTDLRYEMNQNYLRISPDKPYVAYYQVPYVNLARESKVEVEVATQVATTGQGAASGQGGGGGRNKSSTQINSTSNNQFWQTLVLSIQGILGEGGREQQQSNVITYPESGLLTVRATSRQHKQVRAFLNEVLNNAQRQVLIEASIVEVVLSERYQAGVDWQRIAGDYTYVQELTQGNLGTPPAYVFRYTNPVSRLGDLSATVRLLESYGNVRVLSSPKIMALNNQTAILRVVDERAYFTVEIQETRTSGGAGVVSDRTYESELRTVPEGLIVSVTPQIGRDGMVILNVRPTITRIVGYVNDPVPALINAEVVSRVPEMQVREIESVLKVKSGDIAVLGGLMQDEITRDNSGVPVLSKLPGVGQLFSYRDDDYTKSELVIFLRPLVIKEASLQGDFQDYQRYLPEPGESAGDPPTGLRLNPEQWY